jgi:hypothetical protein
MIRPLRRFHRVAMVLLTLALIILFIAGLLVRPNPQPPDNRQFTLAPTPGGLR